jgi:hypothetical protein
VESPSEQPLDRVMWAAVACLKVQRTAPVRQRAGFHGRHREEEKIVTSSSASPVMTEGGSIGSIGTTLILKLRLGKAASTLGWATTAIGDTGGDIEALDLLESGRGSVASPFDDRVVPAVSEPVRIAAATPGQRGPAPQ